MSVTVSGLLTVGLLVLMLALAYHPLGAWLARTYTDSRHWRLETAVYRVVRVDPDAGQTWRAYAVSVLAFSVVGIVALFILILVQTRLPLAQGSDGMGVTTALNTAVSFVTNTNWQSYAGEVGATPLLQTLGLTVQNFVSAAVGMAVAVAVIRALIARSGWDIGNFWVDLVRGCVRVLLPLAGVAAVLLLAGGVIQNLNEPTTVGSGLYGILVVAIIAVFVAGLMVGRTPELLGKTIGRREITCAALYILVMPVLVLAGTGLSLALDEPQASMLASGPHGLSEVMYAYASAANNNGSAFAGLTADTPWYNLTLAAAMLLGRFVPTLLVLRLAGLLVAQAGRPATAGTMPTHTPLFVTLVTGVALIVALLTFFPALALGPIAEALS